MYKRKKKQIKLVQARKMEIETIKKAQTEGNMKIKYLEVETESKPHK